MVEYKYNEQKDKFTENGYIMFEFDVLRRLKRLAQLEEQIKIARSVSINNVSSKIKNRTFKIGMIKNCVEALRTENYQKEKNEIAKTAFDLLVELEQLFKDKVNGKQ